MRPLASLRYYPNMQRDSAPLHRHKTFHTELKAPYIHTFQLQSSYQPRLLSSCGRAGCPGGGGADGIPVRARRRQHVHVLDHHHGADGGPQLAPRIERADLLRRALQFRRRCLALQPQTKKQTHKVRTYN